MKKIHWVTIIALLIICLSFSIWINQEKKIHLEKLSDLNISNWETYEDTECGIVFKYPSGIKSKGHSSSALIKNPDGKSNPVYQAYDGYTYQYIGQDLSDQYKNLKKAREEKGFEVEEFYYKDRKIVRFNSEGNKIETYSFISSNPTIYILGTSKDACDYEFTNRGGEDFEILNAIVNSIEFTGKHCVSEGNYVSTLPYQFDRLKCCPGLKAVSQKDEPMIADVNICKKK